MTHERVSLRREPLNLEAFKKEIEGLAEAETQKGEGEHHFMRPIDSEKLTLEDARVYARFKDGTFDGDEGWNAFRKLRDAVDGEFGLDESRRYFYAYLGNKLMIRAYQKQEKAV